MSAPSLMRISREGNTERRSHCPRSRWKPQLTGLLIGKSHIPYGCKTKVSFPNRTRGPETEALDEMNVRMRGRARITRLMEANIETKAMKRRQQERPVSSAWK